MINNYKKIWVCKCGKLYYHPFPDLLCGTCGEIVDTGRYAFKVGRWVRTSIWWKPWTWLDGYTEWKKEED